MLVFHRGVLVKIVLLQQQVFMNEPTCFVSTDAVQYQVGVKWRLIIKQTVNSIQPSGSSNYWLSKLWDYLHYMYSVLATTIPIINFSVYQVLKYKHK